MHRFCPFAHTQKGPYHSRPPHKNLPLLLLGFGFGFDVGGALGAFLEEVWCEPCRAIRQPSIVGDHVSPSKTELVTCRVNPPTFSRYFWWNTLFEIVMGVKSIF